MSDPIEPKIFPEDLASPLSDLGNAQILYLWHSAEMKWVPAWQRWFTWSGDLGRWIPDRGAGARAQQTIITLYNLARERVEETKAALEAAKVKYRAGQPEREEAEARHARSLAALRWYVRSQNTERRRGMLAEASCLEGFHAGFEAFDAAPNLLATPSGTVDLVTGERRGPNKRDLMTMGTNVPYDPAAACPAWDAFLSEVMCGDAELVAYLQRIAGYCLTGSTDEHFLGFFYGGGANGKSTFLTLLAEIAGEYYVRAPRGLLFWAGHERHPTELAALHKRRLVICAEVEEGARLDEAKVKDLTGGDAIAARRMREDFWEFSPTHKLLIAGNHWFFVRGQDEGIWRRIHAVPWNLNLSAEQIDTAILAKLRAELPGILAWAVRGAMAWYAGGLAEPPSCAKIRDQFRSDSDLFGLFWADAATADPDGKVTCEVLYEHYIDWAQERKHATVLTRRQFAKRVRAMGARSGSIRQGPNVLWGWSGVRLATAEERASRRWSTDVKT